MVENINLKIIGDESKAVSRRSFIKGVIAGGVAVSSANAGIFPGRAGKREESPNSAEQCAG